MLFCQRETATIKKTLRTTMTIKYLQDSTWIFLCEMFHLQIVQSVKCSIDMK